jgi:hypothetical protein
MRKVAFAFSIVGWIITFTYTAITILNVTNKLIMGAQPE